jgi:hypothetical protein
MIVTGFLQRVSRKPVTIMSGFGAPGERQSARASASAPIVVSSPWPVCTTVYGGSVSSEPRIDARIVGWSE